MLVPEQGVPTVNLLARVMSPPAFPIGPTELQTRTSHWRLVA